MTKEGRFEITKREGRDDDLRAPSRHPSLSRDLSTAVEMTLWHQVIAGFVHGVNQPVLFGSRPLFKLLFPGYCLLNIRILFKVHQFMAIVFLRKARYHSRPMLSHTSLQIVGHADVQRCVGLIGENVCIISIHLDFSTSSK